MKATFCKIVLAGCLGLLPMSSAFAADVTGPVGKKPACCSKEQVPHASYSDKSLFQLDSEWTDQTGTPRKFGSLGGKPLVVTMFFARCQFTCPLLVNDMKRIEIALPEHVKTNVAFVLVSFDSEGDTPEVLAAYHRTHGLDSKWTSLRGQADDVLELAALLGVKFKKNAGGQFAHSNLITVLNAEGEIVHQQVGVNQDVAETAKQLEREVRERMGGVADRPGK
jgi:protein SCO1